jgi:hypothetical protein
MEDTVDVIEIREKKLAQMRVDIDKAFENRRLTTFVLGGEANEETMAEAEQTAKDYDLEEEEYNLVSDTLAPSQAVVDHPHDYKDLLMLAYQKIFTADGYDCSDPELSEYLKFRVEHDLAHEFQHHVPGLGEEGVRIRYGVDFAEDAITHAYGMTPFLALSGKINRKVFSSIIRGADDLSHTDSVLVREK